MTIESILPTPDIFSAKRILCVQPHYDDNDIGAGGILAQLAKNGAELFYLTVTDDLMGIVDDSLSDEDATKALQRDQFAAAKIVGVKEQYWLNYPDAGKYDYFDVRSDVLRYIRMLRPDFIFTCDPWLMYEAHHDHIQTGLATAEAVMFAGLTRIASSDPKVDVAYEGHEIKGMVFYFTREPNMIVDISSTWEDKISTLHCYAAQFSPAGMEELVKAMDMKSQQVAQGQSFPRGEALKVLHPSALHVGI